MKRHGHLWADVIEFDNLLRAARQAQLGKRYRDNVLDFNYDLESNLLQLQDELISQTYRPVQNLPNRRTEKTDDFRRALPRPRGSSRAL